MRDHEFQLTAACGFILAFLLCAGTAAVWGAEESSKAAASASEAVQGASPEAGANTEDEQFGLSLEQRKRVFGESLAAKRRAEREADERYPDHPGSADHAQLADRLSEKYRGEVARKYGLTPKQLEAAISPSTKALIINNPCNPTGAAYSQEELEEICEIAADEGQCDVSPGRGGRFEQTLESTNLPRRKATVLVRIMIRFTESEVDSPMPLAAVRREETQWQKACTR